MQLIEPAKSFYLFAHIIRVSIDQPDVILRLAKATKDVEIIRSICSTFMQIIAHLSETIDELLPEGAGFIWSLSRNGILHSIIFATLLETNLTVSILLHGRVQSFIPILNFGIAHTTGVAGTHENLRRKSHEVLRKLRVFFLAQAIVQELQHSLHILSHRVFDTIRYILNGTGYSSSA